MLMLAPLLTRVGVSWKLPLTLSSEQIAPCEALLFQMCTHLVGVGVGVRVRVEIRVRVRLRLRLRLTVEVRLRVGLLFQMCCTHREPPSRSSTFSYHLMCALPSSG